jgi:hypothetical protein
VHGTAGHRLRYCATFQLRQLPSDCHSEFYLIGECLVKHLVPSRTANVSRMSAPTLHLLGPAAFASRALSCSKVILRTGKALSRMYIYYYKFFARLSDSREAPGVHGAWHRAALGARQHRGRRPQVPGRFGRHARAVPEPAPETGAAGPLHSLPGKPRNFDTLHVFKPSILRALILRAPYAFNLRALNLITPHAPRPQSPARLCSAPGSIELDPL